MPDNVFGGLLGLPRCPDRHGYVVNRFFRSGVAPLLDVSENPLIRLPLFAVGNLLARIPAAAAEILVDNSAFRSRHKQRAVAFFQKPLRNSGFCVKSGFRYAVRFVPRRICRRSGHAAELQRLGNVLADLAGNFLRSDVGGQILAIHGKLDRVPETRLAFRVLIRRVPRRRNRPSPKLDSLTCDPHKQSGRTVKPFQTAFVGRRANFRAVKFRPAFNHRNTLTVAVQTATKTFVCLNISAS